MAKTNLQKVKAIAKTFLFLDVELDDTFPIFTKHPIFETTMQPYKSENGYDMLDITDSDNLIKVRTYFTDLIDNASSLITLYMLIRKPYRLTFLKYVKDYLSSKDFAELLHDAWISSENPNDDINVNIKTLVKWFKSCNKKYLMVDEDYKVYKDLPQRIKIYRGVGYNRNPKGLSWTTSYKTAEWFANRWNKEGYIQKAYIDKENVLAYFNTRGENEIVADVFTLDIEEV